LDVHDQNCDILGGHRLSETEVGIKSFYYSQVRHTFSNTEVFELLEAWLQLN
jgi:hypothetical protein